jgi:hypothetical protein
MLLAAQEEGLETRRDAEGRAHLFQISARSAIIDIALF